ncbi:hypothetical protein B4098_0511 [Heyndrickxia coagulans]|uniref:Uncharacterized protein n=1 Tax=Heyndrickxia coagulans TaxID=1398 RepID=A0A150K5J2_HEYCO|nr:hypothetical protein HMPREF3213_01389 [Heyndrickxia coagulans]KYC64837.1 hypothetical protein B4098_0511 [Heyndrickxia coagulans]
MARFAAAAKKAASAEFAPLPLHGSFTFYDLPDKPVRFHPAIFQGFS